ncbi:MAG: hypothetical protein KDD70_03940, partial [Bdellovibrionales bacterium]|nr:hypothetical protein [Bdellovibrionales bacterium]
LEIDQASLIPGTDTLRLFGIILPVSPRWRREFTSNEQSLTEMQEDARAMINRRLPGFYDRDFASFQKVWREQDERLLYRTTQLELRSSFQSLLAGEISPTQLLQDGDLKGKLMTALPRHSIHTLSRSGLFHSLGSGETTELDMKQAAEIALRHLPGESRLHEDIREISEWKKLVLTKLRDPKDTNKLLQDWIHLLLEDPTADSVMPR